MISDWVNGEPAKWKSRPIFKEWKSEKDKIRRKTQILESLINTDDNDQQVGGKLIDYRVIEKKSAPMMWVG